MNLKAAIFDLDGVITDTARTHAMAWKQLFDAYLSHRRHRLGAPWRPFDLQKDYLEYVDGKPRYDGVEAFLKSRRIVLPRGTPEDAPTTESLCGLGNRKNEIFQSVLERDGVRVYDASVEWIGQLKAANIRVAMATSSKNGPLILQKAKLTKTFETSVDGNDIERLSLQGKPAPDLFLEAARRLQLPPQNCVVIEDALSGVAAGRAGHFGLVIGLIRKNSGEALLEQGADLAVAHLTEISLSLLEERLAL